MSVDFTTFLSNSKKDLGDNFEKVSHTTFLGSKTYLCFDDLKGWSVSQLNAIQRIFRLIFGSYSNTHLKRIYPQLICEKANVDRVNTEKNNEIERYRKDNSGLINFFKSLVWIPPTPPPSSPDLFFPDSLMDKVGKSWSKKHGVTSSCFSQVKKEGEITVKPGDYQVAFGCEKKEYVYKKLTDSAAPKEDISLSTYSLKGKETIQFMPVFPGLQKPVIVCKEGGFSYPKSTDDIIHWTANFADSYLFGYCLGPLLAQDELQVLEHPGLAHLKVAIKTKNTLSTIDGTKIALVTGAKRYGVLDTSKTLSSGRILYGNNFQHASKEEIDSCLTKLPDPNPSNIFSMAAPIIPGCLYNSPYKKVILKQIFYRSYLAFSSIKSKNPSKKNVVHTGNWGAGAFGNSPIAVAVIQLAAARCAGINEIDYYPMGSKAAFEEALKIFNEIEKNFPNMTIDQFLNHLTENATKYNLLYGKSNGT
jgi:hypothetical protein